MRDIRRASLCRRVSADTSGTFASPTFYNLKQVARDGQAKCVGRVPMGTFVTFSYIRYFHESNHQKIRTSLHTFSACLQAEKSDKTVR